MDIDRRYYNRNTGSYYNNYANINLQPGYQQLSGGQALDFVRFRHTDSDLYRVARQQSFVRAFREQVRANFSPLKVPSLVHSLAGNIEIAEGGHPVSLNQIAQLRALRVRAAERPPLPGPHRERALRPRLPGVVADIQKAVQQFTNPDVQSSKAANAAALGRKLKTKAPPPAVGDGDGAERQRRRRRRRQHLVLARAARLQDAACRRTTCCRTRRVRTTSTR